MSSPCDLKILFTRQEYWSGLPFPSPMHDSEKWKWHRSVMSDPQWPHGLQPSRLLRPWDFPGKSAGVGCHCLLRSSDQGSLIHRNYCWHHSAVQKGTVKLKSNSVFIIQRNASCVKKEANKSHQTSKTSKIWSSTHCSFLLHYTFIVQFNWVFNHS